ncbi:MAG TPA: Do family serine endopeptidase [Candidatus Sulfotelmatobacter sp.]|nr:Do family serine endopeptidase [Candidatus Sulfotelmatobacter sp.]
MKQLSKFVSGFVVGLIGFGLCVGAFHSTLMAGESLPTIAVDNTPINRSTSGLTSFAPVVKRAAPSVVNIYSTRVIHFHGYNPLLNDPLFRQFFGNPDGDDHQLTRPEHILGSGIIISSDGYILTASHVIADAEEIKIAVPGNKSEYTGRIIGVDPDTDVAVLKVDAKDLPAITLGDSAQLEVGDIVLAIGNPFNISQPGQTPTVTMGIVSALGRSGLGFSGYENFIQTDAAINPGNSGGALVDAAGRLIGISTAIESSSEGNEGIGFAVPINLARHVAERLISGGKVSRGYLGVHPEDINAGLAYSFNLSTENGALVGFVEPGTPADKAGIKAGDVITSFNGQAISDENDLLLAVADCAPGSKASVKYVRDGKEHSVDVTLSERPGEVTENPPQENQTDALDGVTVADLDSDARSQLQIPDDVQGAIVTDVAPDSHAAEAGLQKADVIIAVDHHSVSNADQVVKLCNEAKGKYILLKVWRKEGDFSGTSYISVDNTKD